MYRIEVFNSYKSIKKLKDLWEKIYRNNSELQPFQSYSWNRCLIENKIYRGKLYFLILYKLDEPLIIAPFIKKNRLIYNELSFLGMNTYSDYLNFIYSKDLLLEDFQYFIAKILSIKKYVILNLTCINESSIISKYLEKLKVVKEVHNELCVKIPIYQTMQEYINILGKSTKKDLKAKQKYIERDFDNIDFKIYKKGCLDKALIKQLMDLYCIRRKEKNNKLNRRCIQFLTQYMNENDDLFLSCCYINKKLVAFNLGLMATSGDICVIIVAINSDYRKYSIGNILIYNTINHIISNGMVEEGFKCKYYDLTRGNELYKYKCGGIEHNNYYYIITNKNFLLNLNNMIRKLKDIAVRLKVLTYKFLHSK